MKKYNHISTSVMSVAVLSLLANLSFAQETKQLPARLADTPSIPSPLDEPKKAVTKPVEPLKPVESAKPTPQAVPVEKPAVKLVEPAKPTPKAIQVAALPAIEPVRKSTATFQQLDELRSQNALLSEIVKNAELQNKLSGNGAPSIGAPVNQMPTNFAPNARNAGMNYGAQGTKTITNGTVTEVSTIGGRIAAKVVSPYGGIVVARVGQHIKGIGTVKSISIDEVVVADGKETISLPFANDSSVGFSGGR